MEIALKISHIKIFSVLYVIKNKNVYISYVLLQQILTHVIFLYSKNMIMRIMPKTFENQLQLEELHLAQNNISELESDMFFGLDSLIVSLDCINIMYFNHYIPTVPAKIVG